MDLALETAARLRHPTLDAHMGHYLLGSTSPDARSLARRRREEYHFAPLSFGSVGAGVRGLFDAHPQLLAAPNGRDPTRAFVAGYLSHLVMDEVWIIDVFRTCFGNSNVFHDEARGLVLDRAAQLELDRLAEPAMEAALPLVAGATEGVAVGFIPAETLDEWRGWVMELVGRGFSWDRLRFMARRIAAGDDSHPAHRVADEFLNGMPGSLDLLFGYVSRDGLQHFRERAVGSVLVAVGDYLS
jgi:hypothetical protein